MPRRKKSTKGRPLRWTLGASWAALEMSCWTEYWGSEAEARRAWLALRAEAPGRLQYCEPFWYYEPGVPDDLRTFEALPADDDGYVDDDALMPSPRVAARGLRPTDD